MQEMLPRERVLASLKHQEPDRIPLDLGGYATTIEAAPFLELKKYLGKKWETRCFTAFSVEIPEELLIQLGIDTRYIRMKRLKSSRVPRQADHFVVDEWGTIWRKPESGLYWDPVDFPLKNATINDLETYEWPDPDDPRRIEGLREKVMDLRERTDYAIIADPPHLGIFEAAWVLLRGPEQFFVDMVLNKPFVKALMEKLADIYIRLYKNYLDAVGGYIDIIGVSDDLGTENGPLISLSSYREQIRPYQKKLWKFIKEHTSAYLFLHSCGSVYNFMPDLIELGVDILNPVQVAAKDMNSKRLKKEFGDKLTFWGGIDSQQILPFGSVVDVEEEVKKRIADFAPGGGYVLAAVHNIQKGVRPENILKMYQTACKYGKYPISI